MISIVMPVKNAGHFLEGCLKSIIGQTVTDWELVAINDHSTDNSGELLNSFALADDRIKCFDANGQGIIDALRQAYRQTTGQYITRMDADDIMPPEKLALLRQALERTPAAVSTGKIKYIGEHLREGYLKYETWMNRLVDQQSHYAEVYRECVIPSPAWMMSRTVFEQIGGFEPDTYPEDYDLTLRLYKAKIPIRAVNEVVHIWRDHADRTSRHDPNYAFNAFEALKTNYFLSTDYDPIQLLVLWGGGKKGKNIALLLQEQKIPFQWACNNPKKIGQDIYGLTMQDVDQIFDQDKHYQVIVAVAEPEAQIIISSSLKASPNLSAFWFC